MERKKILTLIAAFSLLGFLVTGCDDNIPKATTYPLVGLELNEELVGGMELTIGKTANIANKVIYIPANATDRAQNFYSSNPSVATVDARGEVTTNEVGDTEITITVGGKSVSFILTVVGVPEVPFEEISIGITGGEKELKLNETFDLAPYVVAKPQEGTSDVVVYSSSDKTVVDVSDKGELTATDKYGTVKITASSKLDPSVKAELVVKTYSESDYDRSAWTLTATPKLFVEGTNSLTSPLDGKAETWIGLVRPSKSYTPKGQATVSNPSKENGGFVDMIIDMKQETEVSYFRIMHRDNTQLFLRFCIIEKIEGSNDGVTFTTIATNVAVPNALKEPAEIESPNIYIPAFKYRYIRFYCQKDECWFSMSKGASAQLAELYIGKKVTE